MSICETNFEEFEQLQKNFDHVTFSQSVPWIKSRLASGREYKFYTDNVDVPAFILAGEVVRKPILGEAFVIEGGPLINSEIKYQSLTTFLKSLTDIFPLIEINNEAQFCANFEVEVRRAGYTRPLWAKYCPMTIYVNPLNNKLKRDWKYNRNKATKSGVLEARYIPEPTDTDIDSFIQAFTEMKETKGIGHLPTVSEIKGLVNMKGIRFYVIEDNVGALAYKLIWQNKMFAHDIYAANMDRAREIRATHKLLMDLFEDLRREGVDCFDLGRIGPSTNELDSVFVFKRGSGGEIISYNGEWVFSKSFIKELLLLFYRKFIQKRKRW